MARRHGRHMRHSRRGSADIRHLISKGGKIISGLVIGAPAINALGGSMGIPLLGSGYGSQLGQTGTPGIGGFPAQVLYGYTGVNLYNGTINSAQLTTGLFTVGGGIFLNKAFKWLGRHF